MPIEFRVAEKRQLPKEAYNRFRRELEYLADGALAKVGGGIFFTRAELDNRGVTNIVYFFDNKEKTVYPIKVVRI